MNKNVKRKMVQTLAVSLASSMLFSSMVYAANPSRAEVSSWLQNQVGKTFDFDGAFGPQCTDLVNTYTFKFWKKIFSGNAIDFSNTSTNPLPVGWKIQKYYHGMVPKVGDIIVGIGKGVTEGSDFDFYNATYGHVAIVKSATENVLQTYDQNFGYTEEEQRRVTVFATNDYRNVTHIITPVFADGTTPTNKNPKPVIKTPSVAANNNVPTIKNKKPSIASSGSFIFKQNGYVRAEAIANSPVLATYSPGSKVEYDKLVTNDGYHWISYVAYSGNRRYIAVDKLILEQPKVIAKEDVTQPKVIKTPTVTTINSSGVYKFTDSRPVKPRLDINSETLAIYTKGMTVSHDKKIIADGYEWLSYIANSGNRRYIPIKYIAGQGLAHSVIVNTNNIVSELTELPKEEKVVETSSVVDEEKTVTTPDVVSETKEEKVVETSSVVDEEKTVATPDVASETKEEKVVETSSVVDEEKTVATPDVVSETKEEKLSEL